ncbi:HTH-type transcriptional regulator DmlR [Andreprevotia sp. IGB-42]|uniref:LysR family transcriptional regulator n=1 Tax=Andreprevotia sp. IGB-42 TaxID=2497473 RepID=UPI0013583460|nr:LysR family transcriptional regulator [Andreprevotia sp. IGB-42]KAF0814498.1 HTH-type transcriptional regulator DmlR [Andreprevotia sp. IGB-42]
MYTLNDLQLFIRAANSGNFSSAARQLQLTPAAASAAIKRLELALQVRLFERSTRSLRLTAAGALFRDHCERALAVLAEGEAQLQAGQQQLAGDIHLAAPSDLTRAVLSPWLDEFLALHPQLRVVLHVSDALHDLLRDTVDLALRYGDMQDTGLVARKLCGSRQIACAAPAYIARHGSPANPAELAGHNCLTFYTGGRPATAWTFSDGKKAITVPVSGNRCADDSALVRQWALEGAGIVYKSALDVAPDIAAGRLLALLPGYLGDAVSLFAVYPGAKHLPLRVRALLDFLIGRFGQYEVTAHLPVDSPSA